MKSKINTTDPVILGSWPALKRAAKRAWKKSVDTGTPFYVVQDGKIVNLNPKGTLKKRRRRIDSL